MNNKIELDWSSLVDQVLADPKLTETEAQILSDMPDLFKGTKEEFLVATEIVEQSLIRRGCIQPMRFPPPTYH